MGDYIAALRKLSIHCKFGTFLNEAIRDKFVCGITSDTIRKRLSSKRDLDLQKAIELAKGLEEAENQSKIISSEQQQTLTQENAYKIIPTSQRTPLRRETRLRNVIDAMIQLIQPTCALISIYRATDARSEATLQEYAESFPIEKEMQYKLK